MIRFRIAELIPHFLLNDRNGRAVAAAIECALTIFCEKLQEGVDAAIHVERMPEWRLDEVAQEENIFWYDFAASEDEKRKSIISAQAAYALLGTKAGTERAARAVCSDATIREWFEYGGQPAHFRVHSASYEAAFRAQQLKKSVTDVKRLSAVLDGVFIDLPAMRTNVHAGLALYCGEALTLKMPGVSVENVVWIADENGDMLLDEIGMPMLDE